MTGEVGILCLWLHTKYNPQQHACILSGWVGHTLRRLAHDMTRQSLECDGMEWNPLKSLHRVLMPESKWRRITVIE